MSLIAVIEDQPQMRRNLAFILEMEGFSVAEAENGKQGLAMIREQKPALVICDIMMPEMDGFELLRCVRADPAVASTPFIFLSAKGDRTDIRLGMNIGADDYLTKPAAREDLMASVRARLTRREVHQAELATARGSGGFKPDFSSHLPLLELGLTDREAQVLLWVAQGKSNADVAAILSMAEKTVKKHMSNLFAKLGVESRNAASLRAIEHLGQRR